MLIMISSNFRIFRAKLHASLLKSGSSPRSLGDNLPPAVPDLVPPPLHTPADGEAAYQVSF